MAVHEQIVVAYFSAFMLAAWLLPARLKQRVLSTIVAIGVLAATVLLSSGRWPDIRAWIPHVFLVAGYWIPALLVQSPKHRGFEDWLVASDRLLRPWLPSVRGSLADFVELAYLLCYPLIPVSFAFVWANGDANDIDRFWTAVLIAGYSCYATLRWLVSQPPRLTTSDGQPRSRISGVNAFVLGRVSHQLNTFPSGHVAVTAAAAGSVASVSLSASAGLLAFVVAIAVGAAAGRYHYVVDVLLGLIVAVAAVLLARIG